MTPSVLTAGLADGPVPCHVFVPARARQPLLVLVHGLTTRPERLVEYAARFAGRHGVPLLVPDFSAPEFKGYQRLQGQSRPHGAAKALIAAVKDAVELHDLPSCQFHLMGFSAGAQFAHRFALHYPQHLHSLTVASPGWYTYLDNTTDYPFGLGNGTPSPTAADIQRFLKLPILICAGQEDTLRDKQLRTNPELDRQQGIHRLQRARNWHRHLLEEAQKRAIAGHYDFVPLPLTGHSIGQAVRSGGLMEHLFHFVLDSTPHHPAPTRQEPPAFNAGTGGRGHILTECLT